MPADLKITTELLYMGALVFALIDVVCIPLLVWRVNEELFRRLKWKLVIAAALVWCGIWSWAIGNFWETVYSYVFPARARTWIPWIALIAAGVMMMGLWMLSLRFGRGAVLAYFFWGGALGSITHLWAVHRGLLTKPPMLEGPSLFGAITIAFFEYIFYWCVILTVARGMDWTQEKLNTLLEEGFK